MKTADVIPIGDNDLEAQASLWVVKLERGLSLREERDLREWLAASSANRACFLYYAEAWGKTDVLSSLADLFPRTKLDAPAVKRRWVLSGLVSAVTASLLLVFLLPLFNAPAQTGVSPTLSYETAIGGLSRVVLSDGSVLTLNTNTKVEVTMGLSARVLRLSAGEIHINVAKDPLRPFQVLVGETILEAVGTEFNVRIDDSQYVELLVTEGLVRVGLVAKKAVSSDQITANSVEDLLLAQGEKVRLKGLERAIEIMPQGDIEVELSWQQGNLIFRGEPLSDAVAEISRYTSVEFVIVDEDLKAVRVAGLFKSGDVAGFLDSLEANFNIKHERRGNQTYLKSQ